MPEKQKTSKKRRAPVKPEDKIKKLSKQANTVVKEIEAEATNRRCFVLWKEINHRMVEEIYEELRTDYSDIDGELDVIINSGGGDIDAAFNLACLFQKYAKRHLSFIVPRWAKSAATLLVCAGEEVLMTPIAELGPLDPQITTINPMEERFEQFSPLHVQTTLNLIREEYKEGNKDLADGLLKRLQFPITLGSFIKATEIGEQYLTKLLNARMAKTNMLTVKPEIIAQRLSKGYADHGACINIDEARNIGLNVGEIQNPLLDPLWKLYKIKEEIYNLFRKKREQEVKKTIEDLPPEIIDKIRTKPQARPTMEE